MSSFNSSSLPENIRKRMANRPPEIQTQAEADVIFDERSEKKLQQLILNYLKLNLVFVVRQRMDKKSNCQVGTPDFVFAWYGKPVALEVKVGDNKQTEEQRCVEISMRSNGWIYEVVRSLDEVRTILERIKE